MYTINSRTKGVQLEAALSLLQYFHSEDVALTLRDRLHVLPAIKGIGLNDVLHGFAYNENEEDEFIILEFSPSHRKILNVGSRAWIAGEIDTQAFIDALDREYIRTAEIFLAESLP